MRSSGSPRGASRGARGDTPTVGTRPVASPPMRLPPPPSPPPPPPPHHDDLEAVAVTHHWIGSAGVGSTTRRPDRPVTSSTRSSRSRSRRSRAAVEPVPGAPRTGSCVRRSWAPSPTGLLAAASSFADRARRGLAQHELFDHVTGSRGARSPHDPAGRHHASTPPPPPPPCRGRRSSPPSSTPPPPPLLLLLPLPPLFARPGRSTSGRGR